jgi:hypothetical protein
MKPYQERVVAEEKELNEKIDKLYYFLAHNEASMPRSESNMVKIQLAAMRAYNYSLAARIETFHKDEE